MAASEVITAARCFGVKIEFNIANFIVDNAPVLHLPKGSLASHENIPRCIHYIWFGEELASFKECIADKKTLRQNIVRTRGFTSVVWLDRRFSFTGDFQRNVAFLRSLRDELGCDLIIRDLQLDAQMTAPGRATAAILNMIWAEACRKKRLWEAGDHVGGNMWRAWLATMSDVVRQAAMEVYGGIYADIGDTFFPVRFADKWTRLGHGFAPYGCRVPHNPKALLGKENICQPVVAGEPGAALTRGMLKHIHSVYLRDQANGRHLANMTMIGKTLQWTGNGALKTTMRSIKIIIKGRQTDLLSAWVDGCPALRLYKKLRRPKGAMLIKAASNGSWMSPNNHGSF